MFIDVQMWSSSAINPLLSPAANSLDRVREFKLEVHENCEEYPNFHDTCAV